VKTVYSDWGFSWVSSARHKTCRTWGQSYWHYCFVFRGVLGSVVIANTYCSDQGFSWFSGVFSQKLQMTWIIVFFCFVFGRACIRVCLWTPTIPSLNIFYSPQRKCSDAGLPWSAWLTDFLQQLPDCLHSPILIRIWELAGSNIGLETDCPDCGLSWFSSAPTQIPWQYFKLGHDRFLTHSFQVIIHLSSYVILSELLRMCRYIKR
jgi:hypothetical protein